MGERPENCGLGFERQGKNASERQTSGANMEYQQVDSSGKTELSLNGGCWIDALWGGAGLVWAGCSFQRSSGFSSIRVSGSRIEVSTDFRMANRSCHVRKYYRKTEMVYCSPGRKSLQVNIANTLSDRERTSLVPVTYLPSTFGLGSFRSQSFFSQASRCRWTVCR